MAGDLARNHVKEAIEGDIERVITVSQDIRVQEVIPKQKDAIPKDAVSTQFFCLYKKSCHLLDFFIL